MPSLPQRVRTRAVVFRRIPYQEATAIYELFTYRLGRIKVLVRGARRPKSRWVSTLEPFHVIEAVVHRRDTREIQTLQEARILQAYPALRASYDRQRAAALLFDWIRHLVPEDTPAPRLYTLLERVFHQLATYGPSEALSVAFLLRAAEVLGYPPRLDRCRRCGDRRVAYLAATEGGALCASCARQAQAPVVFVGTQGLAGLQKLQKTPLSQAGGESVSGLLDPLLEFLEGVMDLRLPRPRAPQSPPWGETP